MTDLYLALVKRLGNVNVSVSRQISQLAFFQVVFRWERITRSERRFHQLDFCMHHHLQHKHRNQTTRNTAFRLHFKVKCCSHHKSERETVKIKVITLQYDTVFVLISKSLHTLNSHYDNIQMLHDVECHHQKYTVSHKKWQSLYTTITMDNLNRFLPRCM